MKKVLLSFIAVTGLFANSFAQCVSGYSSTGIYDDFSSTAEVGDANGGLYFFAGTGAASPVNCTAFSAVSSRTTNAGKLSVVINAPYGCYTPFGYSFGTTPTGAKRLLNLTANKTFTIDVTNPSSDTSSIIFRMALQDSLDRRLDTYAAAGTAGTMPTAGSGNCNNAYGFTIATAAIAPGATVTFSGTFAGAFEADYGKTAPQAAGTTGTDCFLKNNLDFTLVSQVLFTVTNSKQNAADGYKPWGAGNGTNPLVILDNFRVGTCPTSAGTNEANASITSSKLYPNPTSDVANVELNLRNHSNVKVTVSDMMGKEVMIVAEGSMSSLNKSFSVSSLQKGMYTVNYFVDGAAAKAEMLMVK